MPSEAERVLGLIIEHHSQATLHLKRMGLYLDQFTGLVSPDGRTYRPASNVRCIRVWEEWLTDNGPNTRQHITEATGTKLTERATPHTVLWEPRLETEGDAIPPNTLTRFNTIRDDGSKGRPPVVYALWSQRYEVRDLFGVGPIRPAADETDTLDEILAKQWDEAQTVRLMVPDELTEPSDDGTLDDEIRELLTHPVEPLTGVIYPPAVQSPYALADGPWNEQAFDYMEDMGEIRLTAEDLTADGIVPTVQSNEDGDGDDDG
jgi:hypothetical protein